MILFAVPASQVAVKMDIVRAANILYIATHPAHVLNASTGILMKSMMRVIQNLTKRNCVTHPCLMMSSEVHILSKLTMNLSHYKLKSIIQFGFQNVRRFWSL